MGKDELRNKVKDRWYEWAGDDGSMPDDETLDFVLQDIPPLVDKEKRRAVEGEINVIAHKLWLRNIKDTHMQEYFETRLKELTDG